MAGDAANVHIYEDAPDIYAGPVGTTGPTDLTTALNAAFDPVGLLDGDEGLTEGRATGDTTEIRAWGGALIKVTKGTHTRTFRAVLLEDNAITFGLVNPGSTSSTTTGVTTRVVKVPVANEKAFVIELSEGGDVTKRVHIPRGEITEIGDIVSGPDDPTAYDVTITVYSDSGGILYTEIVPDPV